MKVQFLKDTTMAQFGEILPNTYVIYYDGYALPNIDGVEYIDFLKFKSIYPKLDIGKIILFGMNRIITPANRCEMVYDFLFTMMRHIPKISIDADPFIGEPWRVWYHYGVTNSGYFNISYSYVIETEWKHWFYRDTNICRLSGENIKSFIGDTYSDLDKLAMEVRFIDVDDATLQWYGTLKEHVFNKYHTPKTIILSLLKEANKRFDLSFDYDFYRLNQKICLPDLGIYRFVAEENERRMKIYNALTGY